MKNMQSVVVNLEGKVIEQADWYQYHVERVDRIQVSHSLKRIRLSQTIIKNLLHWCKERLDLDVFGRPRLVRNGKGGIYYAKVLKYAQTCMQQGMINLDGIPCKLCEKTIFEGDECISCSRGTARKYFHMPCAEKINII